MSYLKMVGLAAVAAAALMAVVGAGTASATELCSTNTTPCSGTKYNSGTVLKATLKTGTKAVLNTNIDSVTCTAAEVGGTTSSNGGSGATAVSGSIATFAFTNCTDSFGTSCLVMSVNTPYTASLTGSGASASLAVTSTNGAGAIVVCGSLINCAFKVKGVVLPTNGSVSPPVVTANKVALERSGPICPEAATWTATYVIGTPSPLFIV